MSRGVMEILRLARGIRGKADLVARIVSPESGGRVLEITVAGGVQRITVRPGEMNDFARAIERARMLMSSDGPTPEAA